MAVQMKPESPLRAAITVSSMCRKLGMSRSQFYWHVKRGTFHSPLFLSSNKRPYFTASMVEDNLKARESGIGVNGEYVLFYERLTTGPKPEGRKPKADYASLLDGLKNSGLDGITNEQVEAALAAAFPKGTGDHDEANVLRIVFRHLKRSGVG